MKELSSNISKHNFLISFIEMNQEPALNIFLIYQKQFRMKFKDFYNLYIEWSSLRNPLPPLGRVVENFDVLLFRLKKRKIFLKLI